MLEYTLKQTDTGESFGRNFVLYLVFNGSKNIHCVLYFMKNVTNVEDISIVDWCQYTIDRLCESAKKRASNFDNPILFL